MLCFSPLWASMTAYCPPPLSKLIRPTTVIQLRTRAHVTELSGLQRATALRTEAQKESNVQGVPSTEQALTGARNSCHILRTALQSWCVPAKGHDNQCPGGPEGAEMHVDTGPIQTEPWLSSRTVLHLLTKGLRTTCDMACSRW